MSVKEGIVSDPGVWPSQISGKARSYRVAFDRFVIDLEDKCGIIPRHAERIIAIVTEQSANEPVAVVVIDDEGVGFRIGNLVMPLEVDAAPETAVGLAAKQELDN